MAIAARVEQLAREIAKDLPVPDPLIIGLLTGSFIFIADLVRALARLNVESRIDFMAVSHYGSATESSGLVKIVKDVTLDVSGQSVLLVDDILDTGRSLSLARDLVRAGEPVPGPGRPGSYDGGSIHRVLCFVTPSPPTYHELSGAVRRAAFHVAPAHLRPPRQAESAGSPDQCRLRRL